MKKLFLSILVIGVSILSADILEVKDANGVDYVIINKPSVSKHYVCYNSRVRYISNGIAYLRYNGCKRYSQSCSSLGKAHFGHYPTNQAAIAALHRCKRATPRFVD